MTTTTYYNNILRAIRANPDLRFAYAGKSGAKRFAHDFGYGLADSETGLTCGKWKFKSYALCKAIYGRVPPCSESEWAEWIEEGYQKARRY